MALCLKNLLHGNIPLISAQKTIVENHFDLPQDWVTFVELLTFDLSAVLSVVYFNF
jgi:hypothetical protein